MEDIEWKNVHHFYKYEFVESEKIRTAIVYILDDIREEFGKPIKITSSLRNPQSNLDVGGVQNSAHLLAPDGMYSGIDFAPESGITDRDRYLIMNIIGNYTSVCRIGLYKLHFHIDIERRLPQEVLWISDTN